MKKISLITFCFLFTSLISSATLSPPDTLQVISHHKTNIITDPSRGFNEFPSWAVFPSSTASIRKITLFVTYECPDSLHCGEWDYIDHIYLGRAGGLGSSAQHLEIARLISPYGWRFDQEWSFTWKVDVTDFSLLLRDSTEIVFNHTGYENNTDRGWMVTCRFEVITGRPARELLGMDTLWQGSFPYGDSSGSIENYLSPRTIICGKDVTTAILRILQTGHGMDDLENCAEFCNKFREVILDGNLKDHRQIWQECGTNPLYPQAGTWIFDRANWCPGSMVQPHRIELPVKPGTSHILDVNMQPYVNPGKPSASYSFSSSVFYYAVPWAKNDVSIEDIIAPSSNDEFGRSNPVCMNPMIRMKNNGRRIIESVSVQYGFSAGQATYLWKGRLDPQEIEEVELPWVFPENRNEGIFAVVLEMPNGKKDDYPFDNSMSSDVPPSPVYASPLQFILKTNNESHHNAYRIVDHSGRIISEKKLGSMKPQTVYRDTLRLTPGCYEILVNDTAGDGLDFWFNPEGGYGYVRLLDLNGRLVKSFLSDFGSDILHSFRVAEKSGQVTPEDELPIAEVFPPRNQGIFHIEVFNNDPWDVFLKIFTSDTSHILFDRRYPDIKEGTLPVDLTSQPDGTYIIQILTKERLITRRIRITHDPSARAAPSYAFIGTSDTPDDIIGKAARVVPSRQQLAWQKNEFTAFIHFGMNTFTDQEWGDGTEDPDSFHPTDFDARQWVRVIRDAGMKMLILTAKHHDGFCLWPSHFTDYSVENSSWRQGKADVVAEVASACQEAGIKFGIYLSPWDRHEPSYGDSHRYNEFFRNQLRELLTNYGEIAEVWFDGACGEGPNGKRQEYDWLSYYRMIRELQPGAVIFGMGPDVRWVGTESGVGRETEWSVLPDVLLPADSVPATAPFPVDPLFIPGDRTAEDLGSRERIHEAKTLYWYPSEADVSIRPGWFYHTDQDSLVKSPGQLVDLYFSSVGRNSVLLLNIPPDKNGRIHESDIASLTEMKHMLDRIFDTNRMTGAEIRVSSESSGHEALFLADGKPDSFWAADSSHTSATIEIILPKPASFDVLMLQENVKNGQRIEQFYLEAYIAGQWKRIAEGTTVGYIRLLRFDTVQTDRVRLVIAQARLNPELSEMGIYRSQ